MHIFFCGIGGGGLGPLAQIAQDAGYDVSGSDAQSSAYTGMLTASGIDFYIGQSAGRIAELHAKKPIDWFVVTSAITRANPNHPELLFAKEHGIKVSRRDELLAKIIADHHLRLIGVAGTHGKSTTTAMIAWLFEQLGQPYGHSVGAKIPFAPMGRLQPGAQYFMYECDEFDNNFLAFHPYIAVVTGIAWDHHEIFPTQESYKTAYRTFLQQSERVLLWRTDAEHIHQPDRPGQMALSPNDPQIAHITLPGDYNRRDAWLAVHAVHLTTNTPITTLIEHINTFPGLKQRMEELIPGLYTNYAHTPEKITGGMLAALEIARTNNQAVVVIYEPLTNRRQHHIKNDYKDCFAGAKNLYWVPTYLAREDPNLPVLSPAELIPYISNSAIAEPAEMNHNLLTTIKNHLAAGDMVVAMGASGAGSLDEWLRKHFTK